MGAERAPGGGGGVGLEPPSAVHDGAAELQAPCGGHRNSRLVGSPLGRSAGGVPMLAILEGSGKAAGGVVPAAVEAASLPGTAKAGGRLLHGEASLKG